MNRLEEFLKELSELTKKYELAIDACGCCRSPWVIDLKREFELETGLCYNEKDQKYTVDSMR